MRVPVTPSVGSGVSIRAPREGSDVDVTYSIISARLVSIRAPREGSDSWCIACPQTDRRFNPRPP